MNKVEERLRKYYEYREYPPDSLEYQDSLDIYLSLRSLLKNGKIDTADVQIVDCICSGYSFRKTARMVGIDRRSIRTRYGAILELLESVL